MTVHCYLCKSCCLQHIVICAVLKVQVRQRLPLQPGAYNLATYLGYLFYPPLYIAGPIITFNSFASQLKQPMPLHLKQVSRESRLAAVHTCILVVICKIQAALEGCIVSRSGFEDETSRCCCFVIHHCRSWMSDDIFFWCVASSCVG